MTTTTDRPLPPVTDRARWQARVDELRVRENAHTRAGDALAAERRRLPMVEVFERRSQLLVPFLMWHIGKRAAQPDAVDRLVGDAVAAPRGRPVRRPRRPRTLRGT